MISGLRRFDRLVAKSGQDETVRLVEKWLIRGNGAAKCRGHCCRGGVSKSSKEEQGESGPAGAQHN
jgi:hypothetical protein